MERISTLQVIRKLGPSNGNAKDLLAMFKDAAKDVSDGNVAALHPYLQAAYAMGLEEGKRLGRSEILTAS